MTHKTSEAENLAADAVAQALQGLVEQEQRLLAEQSKLAAEVARLREARRVLERKSGIKGAVSGERYAQRGELEGAILRVLAGAKEAMSRVRLISAVEQAGYPHSLYPSRVTKVLSELVEAKLLKRTGERNMSRYSATAAGVKRAQAQRAG